MDRFKSEEKKREKIIKEETGSEIITINPEKENFDIDDEIGKIQVFISDSKKKLTKESTKNEMLNDAEEMTKMVKQLCV